ncbi:hypothetical protein D3C71_1329140 [compost metagenome]
MACLLRVLYRCLQALAGGVDRALVALVHGRPVDISHEGIDIRARCSAVVEVVGMFIHVQREDGHPTGSSLGVVAGPLVDECAIARLEHQQHPSRAAAQCLAHGDKLFTPALSAAKAGCQGQQHAGGRGGATAAQAAKVQFVQQHRIAGDQLLALESVDDKAGRGGKVQPRELRPDGVEPRHRTAIVILVVAAQQPFGQAWQRGRVKGKGLGACLHGDTPGKWMTTGSGQPGFEEGHCQPHGRAQPQQRHHPQLEAEQRHQCAHGDHRRHGIERPAKTLGP